MTAATASFEQDAVVMPPLRPDLVITRQVFEGRTYYVIKDPISLQYFRLTAEDYLLATLFDGRRTFAAIREAYLQRLPHLRLELTIEEINERIMRFANDLALMQFLAVQGQRLKARYEHARQLRKRRFSLYKLVNNLFFGRFSLYDPDVLFGKMARPLWWIWTKTTLWVSVALVVAATVIFLRNTDRIEQMMAHFFSLQNIALMWVITIVMKSIHELGHGLTCKHFGGEVHEIGVMVLVFTPYFYVNVSDSWVMPDRKHRILVSAAGIYVELIFAALATFAWVLVQPGALQQALYNVIVIASISTIVFNANPLMRFDGYYILVDLLEVPNLQAKSRALISHQVKRLLFGRNVQDPVLDRMPLPKKRFWLFYIYAVLSWLYGYYIIYRLSLFMAPHLAPYGLEGLANWLTALALFAWIVMPFIGFFKSLRLTMDDWKPKGRLRRLALIGGVTALCCSVLCWFPKQLTITRAVAVQIAEPDAIRADVAGFVAEVFVHEGERLAAGAPVARLANREVEERLHAAEKKLAIADALIARSLGLDRPVELRQAQAARAEFLAALDQARHDFERLTLRTTTGGTVLTRELHRLMGTYLKSGDLFCEVAPLDRMRIRLPLAERQVRYVREGQPVQLRVLGYPGRSLHGRIAEEPLTVLGKEMPAALSKARAGDVPTATDREGAEVPLERTYVATVEVDNPDGMLRPGMTGRAKIYTGRHRLGRLVFQSLLDLVSLDYRF